MRDEPDTCMMCDRDIKEGEEVMLARTGHFRNGTFVHGQVEDVPCITFFICADCFKHF